MQWNLSFGTPPFRGQKLWSWKNIHIIFVSVTSIEGTPVCTQNELKVSYLCTLSHLEPLTVALFQPRITQTFENSRSYSQSV